MRVARGSALWSQPMKAQRRRRCNGHLTEPHFIEAGGMYVRSAIPPNSEYGNTGWWTAVFCVEKCAPEPHVSEVDRDLRGGVGDRLD